jgi:hypothetical protein
MHAWETWFIMYQAYITYSYLNTSRTAICSCIYRERITVSWWLGMKLYKRRDRRIHLLHVFASSKSVLINIYSRTRSTYRWVKRLDNYSNVGQLQFTELFLQSIRYGTIMWQSMIIILMYTVQNIIIILVISI